MLSFSGLGLSPPGLPRASSAPCLGVSYPCPRLPLALGMVYGMISRPPLLGQREKCQLSRSDLQLQP